MCLHLWQNYGLFNALCPCLFLARCLRCKTQQLVATSGQMGRTSSCLSVAVCLCVCICLWIVSATVKQLWAVQRASRQWVPVWTAPCCSWRKKLLDKQMNLQQSKTRYAAERILMAWTGLAPFKWEIFELLLETQHWTTIKMFSQGGKNLLLEEIIQLPGHVDTPSLTSMLSVSEEHVHWICKLCEPVKYLQRYILTFLFCNLQLNSLTSNHLWNLAN